MNNEAKMVSFFNTQAHGAAKDITDRAKVVLAEWALLPGAYFAVLIERSQRVFDPTVDESVWLDTDVSAVFFEDLEGLETFVKSMGEEPVEPNRAVRLSKFEWDLGFNLIP